MWRSGIAVGEYRGEVKASKRTLTAAALARAAKYTEEQGKLMRYERSTLEGVAGSGSSS